MKINIKQRPSSTQEYLLMGRGGILPSISHHKVQSSSSSLLMRRNNHLATAREISLQPSLIVIHVVMTALCIALTTFLFRLAQKIVRSMIGTLETWAILAESTNWQHKFEEFSNHFVARIRRTAPTIPSSSSSSPTETMVPSALNITDSGTLHSDHAHVPNYMVESMIHTEMDNSFSTNVPPLVPVSFVSSSSMATTEAIQSHATGDLNLSTVRPMYYPMPLPTQPTTFFIPSGEEEEIQGNDSLVVVGPGEGAKESNPSIYAIILQMEELQRQANFVRLEAEKAEAELAALLSAKSASQPTATGISTSRVTSSNIEDNIAVDDGIVIGTFTTAPIPPAPTMATEQGFEANKRERQFMSPSVFPAFVPSSSSQTGIPHHPTPFPSFSQSQGLVEEENPTTQIQAQSSSPSSLPSSDGAVNSLTTLRKEAEEMRMAELAVLAERNLVLTQWQQLFSTTAQQLEEEAIALADTNPIHPIDGAATATFSDASFPVTVEESGSTITSEVSSSMTLADSPLSPPSSSTSSSNQGPSVTPSPPSWLWSVAAAALSEQDSKDYTARINSTTATSHSRQSPRNTPMGQPERLSTPRVPVSAATKTAAAATAAAAPNQQPQPQQRPQPQQQAPPQPPSGSSVDETIETTIGLFLRDVFKAVYDNLLS